MSDEKYNNVLSWAKDNGLKIHPNLERKCVDGVYGMYAKDDIPVNEVVAQFPKDKLLPILDDFNYPKGMPDHIKYLHTATKELAKGDSAWGFMKGLYEDEFFEQYNAYYYSDKELEILKKLDRLLYEYVIASRNRIDLSIKTICDIDKDIDPKLLIRIILNQNSRGWNEVGFIPILDMFNHSDLYGCSMRMSGIHIYLASTMDYKKGDQVWMSYGKKDVYQHAIDYGYFDPQGHHCLDLGSRIIQNTGNEFQKKIFQHIKNKYKVNHKIESNGSVTYQVSPGQAYLLENAPNVKAIDLIRDLSFRTELELANKTTYTPLFRWRMLKYIEGLNEQINVDQFILEDLPERMQYFYHMLVRVKEILNRNKEWVMTDTQSPVTESSIKFL